MMDNILTVFRMICIWVVCIGLSVAYSREGGEGLLVPILLGILGVTLTSMVDEE